MAAISDELGRRLSQALKIRRLPSAFAEHIADALREYPGVAAAAEAKRDSTQRRDAVERIVKAVRTLQRESARADVAFGTAAPARRSSHHVGSAWHALEGPLAESLSNLQGWLSRCKTKSRRGNPHEGRYELRLQVLGALRDAELPISNSAEGAAAKVLSVVLEEADRVDGKNHRARASFNGSQWAQWVNEFEYIDKMTAARVPLTASAMNA